MRFNRKKKRRKDKEEKEEHMYYDVVRSSDGRRTIIPKLVDGEEQVSFDSVEAETFIRRCLDPMIAEAVENMKLRMNDKAFFGDFMACNVRMVRVFERPFSFGLSVEQSDTGGMAYLAAAVIEPGTSPMFESTVYFMKGGRNQLLEYIERDSFREELFSMMKELMHKHHKELLRLQSDE